MAFDSSTHAAIVLNPPASGTLTDRTRLVVITPDIFDSSTDAATFYNWFTETSDFTKMRFCKSDGTTELAFDVIYSDWTSSTDFTIAVRVLWTGDMESTGSYTLWVMPALTGNDSYGVNDTYGQYAAYPSNVAAYYPAGGGTDRTGNQATGTATTGDSTVPTEGDSDGVVGPSTSYDYDLEQYFSGMDWGSDLSEVTFMALVNNTDTPGDSAIVFDRANGATGLVFYDDETVGYNWGDRSGAYSFDSGLTITDGEWQLWSAAIGQSTQRLGLNDSYATNDDENTDTVTLADGCIGEDTIATRYFDGYLQNILIFNEKLDENWTTQEYSEILDNASTLGTVSLVENQYEVTVESGSFAISGGDATMLHTYALQAAYEQIDVTGGVAVLEYTGAELLPDVITCDGEIAMSKTIDGDILSTVTIAGELV